MTAVATRPVSTPSPVADPSLLRTADQLRAGDIVELFPGRPMLVLAAHDDPDGTGLRRVVVLGPERDWSMQLVDPDTWYVLRSRGPLGRSFDKLQQLRRAAVKR